MNSAECSAMYVKFMNSHSLVRGDRALCGAVLCSDVAYKCAVHLIGVHIGNKYTDRSNFFDHDSQLTLCTNRGTLKYFTTQRRTKVR